MVVVVVIVVVAIVVVVIVVVVIVVVVVLVVVQMSGLYRSVMLGKTQFAKSSRGVEEALVVPCQNATSPFQTKTTVLRGPAHTARTEGSRASGSEFVQFGDSHERAHSPHTN